MDPEITLVTLGVRDIDESIRFYRDGLGFPLHERDADSDVAFFTLDGTWLSVYPKERLAEDATVPEEGTAFLASRSPIPFRRRRKSTRFWKKPNRPVVAS